MKAKYVLWYFRKIKEETLRTENIFLKLQTRTYLTEEEVRYLIDSNRKICSYAKLIEEYIEEYQRPWYRRSL